MSRSIVLTCCCLVVLSSQVRGQDFAPAPDEQQYGYGASFRAGSYFGETYAEPSDFFAIDVFKPLRNQMFGNGDELLMYLDARFALNLERHGVANIGLGQRQYFAGSDFILDGNVWYDIDGSRNRLFHQLGAGAKFYNPFFSLRGNYYQPVGEANDTSGFTPLTGNVGYSGNILALERFRILAEAYAGYDAEIGLHSDMLELFVGYYNFTAEQGEDVTGVTATAQTTLFDALQLSVQATIDDNDEENYMFGVAYNFGTRPVGPKASMRDRLGERIRRNRHIVQRESLVYAPLAAENTSGVPFNIVHASATGNSNGTFESPYSSLASAVGDAAATENSIVLLHADSVFENQSVTVPDGIRFLGEGIDHTVTTKLLGDITLPRATTGINAPTILNSPAASPALALGSNLEVNNVRVADARGTAISLEQSTGGLIFQNVVVDGAQTGMRISEAMGTVEIAPLNISNVTGVGLLIEDTQPGASLKLNDVIISDTGAEGIRILGSDENSAIEFAGQTSVSNTGSHGIEIAQGSDEGSIKFTGPVSISSPDGSGIRLSNRDDDVVGTGDDIEFGTVSIDGASGPAIQLVNNGSNLLIDRLSITNWQTTAIEVDNSVGNLTVTRPLTLNNINGSTDPTIFMTGQLRDVKFPEVTITDTLAAGGDPTVHLLETDTNVGEINFQRLTIDSANRVALGGTERGSNFSKLVITGGSITTDGASAIDLEGQSTDVTLNEVNVTNATTGIRLVDVGSRSAFHQGFRVLGGTIENVDRGIDARGTDDLTIDGMSIDTRDVGIRIAAQGNTQSQRATVTDVTLRDVGGTANWVGIDIDWGRGAHFGDTNQLARNTIQGTGADQTGIRVRNNGSNLDMLLAIEDNSIELIGPTSTGMLFDVTGVLASQTANFGGITLSGAGNNFVTVTGTPAVVQEQTGATVEGAIIVNGVAFP